MPERDRNDTKSRRNRPDRQATCKVMIFIENTHGCKHFCMKKPLLRCFKP